MLNAKDTKTPSGMMPAHHMKKAGKPGASLAANCGLAGLCRAKQAYMVRCMRSASRLADRSTPGKSAMISG